MKRIPLRLIGTVAAIGLLTAGAAFAQRRISDGRRLDSNLQVGSGGYNRQVNQTNLLRRQGYSIGRDSSLYVVDSSGEMRYSRNNAFNTGRYQATGYRGQYTNTGRSATSLRRFRY
jgi:hypothetical protein